MRKKLQILITLLLLAAASPGWAAETTDVLNREFTGVTKNTTTYTDWSGKTGTSGAVYAGQSAGGNDAIQLRTNNSNSGIVTTTSGGKVTKVKVTWNSGTGTSRVLDVYGKNTAYSAATDLYDTSNQGTLLGSISYSSSPVELSITGDYAYIGLRSQSGAMYLDEIDITWTTGGTTPTSTATAQISSTSITVGATANITTTPSNLAVTYFTSDANVATVASGVVTGVAAGTATITATWAQQTISGTTYAAGSETFTVTVTPATSRNFQLYSGSLVEGDYIIYYNGKAMNTTVASNRLQYAEVTPTSNVITTSDYSIVWHIAPSGSYWTIYNDLATAYAASTGTKNQAQMLADGTDDKALWTASGDGTYEFVNKYNAANSINANLRNNGTYGFACYGTGTGGALSLYKAVEDISTVLPPSLTASFSFFPKTTETASATYTIAPLTAGSTVRYTTDGSEPTTSNGTVVTASTTITIYATTTVKAIAYYGTTTSEVVTATYTLGQTVNSIAAFKALASGTEARLYLSPENNARVIHYNGTKKAFLRDNTGAICIFLDASIFNPVPAHNQHVAGWIIGKYQPYNGLPELVATSNTTTDYIAFAEPVTETPTAPQEIGSEEFGEDYYADWVKINDLRVTNDGTNINATEGDLTLKVYNDFALSTTEYYQDPYNNALVDLTGIATPYNSTMEIVPIFYDDYRPVIYVVDETKEFSSPSADITNATVRLKRTLSNSFWNTFAVPFNDSDIAGTIREYDKLDTDGTTMLFKDAETIEAGKPYLIMPENNITNPVYYDVTLTATPAQTVTDGGYNFVATYGPATLATDKTDRFLKTDGYLYYPASAAQATMKGMRAYFNVPASADAKVNIDGKISDMIADIDMPILMHSGKVYSITGQLVGIGTEGLPRGIYIVNGKKVLIK